MFLLESQIQFSGGANYIASGCSRLIIRWGDIAYSMPQKSSNCNSYGNQTVEIGTEINNLITSVCEIKTSVSLKCSKNHFSRGKAKIKVEKC